MLVGIHTDPHGWLRNSGERFAKILEFNDVPYVWLSASQLDFWERVEQLSLFVFNWYGTARQRDLALTIIPIIERAAGVPCYPNTITCWPYDDKIREYYLLRQDHAPVVDTWIFWDRDEAFAWARQASYPLVAKLKGGASSQNVILVRGTGQAKRLIRRMFGRGIRSGHVPLWSSVRPKEFFQEERLRQYGGKIKRMLRGEEAAPFDAMHRNYILFQRFLPNNDNDTRIYVIGNRAFGYRRKVRKNDFRASGSGMIDFNPDEINRECIRIAFEVSRHFGFQTMAYDFLLDESHRPRIIEMSYQIGVRGIPKCPGYWDRRLKWHPGHYWPEYFILMDALHKPGLRQPDMQIPA